MKKTPLKKKAKAKTNSWYRKQCVLRAKRIALERDDYTCQRCGEKKIYGKAIHASHVFPEGKYHSLSANPENIKALCYQCHFLWWHKNPIEAAYWFKEKFPDRYRKLRRLAQSTIKPDWKKEYEKYKKKLEEL